MYFEQTQPVIDYYRHQGVLEEVDGSQDVEGVGRAILHAVRSTRSI